MAALKKLGVPYTAEQMETAQEDVSGKYEIDALVAYLQALGKTHSVYNNKR
jgi:cytochrome c oxidase cbb3-type subunit 2